MKKLISQLTVLVGLYDVVHSMGVELTDPDRDRWCAVWTIEIFKNDFKTIKGPMAGSPEEALVLAILLYKKQAQKQADEVRRQLELLDKALAAVVDVQKPAPTLDEVCDCVNMTGHMPS